MNTPTAVEAALFVAAHERAIGELLHHYSVSELHARTRTFLRRLELVSSPESEKPGAAFSTTTATGLQPNNANSIKAR